MVQEAAESELAELAWAPPTETAAMADPAAETAAAAALRQQQLRCVRQLWGGESGVLGGSKR